MYIQGEGLQDALAEPLQLFRWILEAKLKEELTYAFRSESVNKLKALLTLIDKFAKETNLITSPLLVDSILMTQGSSGSRLGNRVSSAVHFAPPPDLVSANGSFAMNSGRRDLGM